MTTAEAKAYPSAGEVIADAIRPIALRYRENVNFIAAKALEITDEDEHHKFVHDSVDGSEWITYYQNARAVAMVTGNLDALQKASIVVDFDSVRSLTALAFFAMQEDVMDAVVRLG